MTEPRPAQSSHNKYYESAKKRFILATVLAGCIFMVTIPALFFGEDSIPEEPVQEKLETQADARTLGLEEGRLFGMMEINDRLPQFKEKRLRDMLEKHKQNHMNYHKLPNELWQPYVDAFCKGYPLAYKQEITE